MIKKNITYFKKNSLVIHLKHGIGRYQGLNIIKNNNISTEYITIVYANNDKLYVPIENLYLIKHYHDSSGINNINLNKLGCHKWIKKRDTIFKKVNDTAIQILENHAYRKSKKGFSFHINIKEYNLFCKNCPFEITKDQITVMNAVLSDMHAKKPMDRLICGDVGFGKTEIAIRAAFIAVKNDKQVVMLVPTTLLVQQHYKNLRERFTKYNINIEIISRFQSHKEQSMCFKNILNGSTNILIGTHKILFSKIIWNNLGLIIVDEEHKFGVIHKEKIKKFSNNIDILTLTATPIPRTLNMTKNYIQDLSIINTPPKNRCTVKTFVKKYNQNLIRKIILFEIKRNGQIYYICNQVKNLIEKLMSLRKLVPEAKFMIGHGKMNGKKLQKIINNFLEKKFHVLICTTIIEIGLDIPTVNSIIIENADSFGLAQLYQMRGRVGRSNIQAYAWLLISEQKKNSLNKKKRLEVIKSIKDFSSGYELAQHDLKIRGAGELLGEKQSGHIKNIEFFIYKKFLKKTIEYIKENNSLSIAQLKKNQPEIKLFIPTILPEKYISSVDIRLLYYKKILSAEKNEKLLNIKNNLIKNFGILPQEVKNLLLKTKIKILLNQIGITKIQSNQLGGKIEFINSKKINTIKLLKLFNSTFKKWKLNNEFSLKFIYQIKNDKTRIQWILNFLKNIKNIFDTKN
ncbi:DEAD/DEAH box helicase [Buchnera aphidicola]|uniref:DEAD/DEAH box helicase n=1 Tax=Buchnera aphidicola TaxID=9 RepID=UPI0031B88A2E